MLAYVLLPYAADSLNEYREYGVETVVHYNPAYLVSAFIFGAVFPVLVGMLHIFRANQQPLKDIILNTTHTVQERSKTAAVIGVFLLAGSMGLHLANQQDKLLFAVGAVLCLFIIGSIIRNIFIDVAGFFTYV